MKGKIKTRTGVSDLIIRSVGNEETLTKTDQEPNTDIPKLENKVVDCQLEDINIYKKDVDKKLMKLKIDKSTGPEVIHPRLESNSRTSWHGSGNRIQLNLRKGIHAKGMETSPYHCNF